MKKGYLILLGAVCLGMAMASCGQTTGPCGAVGKTDKAKEVVRLELPDWGEREKPEETSDETEWVVEKDEPNSIYGPNLCNGWVYKRMASQMAEGNGCAYTIDRGWYGGKPEEERESGHIYRLKGSQWETFAFHHEPDIREWIEVKEGMRYFVGDYLIGNLVYKDGYLYYRVLKDGEPETYSPSKQGFIYRLPEEGGEPEEMAVCENIFYVYNEKIYYKTVDFNRETKAYWEMDLEGKNRRLIYKSELDKISRFDLYYHFTVGGGSLYLKEGDGIMGVNLETGETRYFEPDTYSDEDFLYFDDHYLYYCGMQQEGIFRMDVISQREERITERTWGYCIREGKLYYINWEETGEDVQSCFLNRMDLETKETTKIFLLEEEGAEKAEGGDIEYTDDKIFINVTVYFPDEGEVDKWKDIYLRNKWERIEEEGSWQVYPHFYPRLIN